MPTSLVCSWVFPILLLEILHSSNKMGKTQEHTKEVGICFHTLFLFQESPAELDSI